MPRTWEVDTVQDAVQLAQEMRMAGDYAWFRGQTTDWPPHSGLRRLQRGGDATAIARARERLKLFCQWLEVTPDLNPLLIEDPPHRLFAIAQHYGIPTHYVDFTTDPSIAGFFAADGPAPADGRRSCIYCLDTEDLMDDFGALVAAHARSPGSIEPVEIDVDNLWRLQSQRGVFLIASYDWDIDYPLDRILFPHTGYPSYPQKGYVYPVDKSALEHLLDQYFDIERKHFGKKQIQDLIAELRAKGNRAPALRMTSHPNGVVAEAFLRPTDLRPLPSWGRSAHPDWKLYRTEEFDAIGGRIERISVGSADRLILERAVAYGVAQALGRSPDLRTKLIEWTLEGPAEIPRAALQTAFRSAWNGMRQRPYTDAQISRAFSVAAGLIVAGVNRAATDGESRQRFAIVRGEGLRVELAYANRASSQGLVSISALRAAMRTDVGDLIASKYQDNIGSEHFILQVLQNPRILFDFDRLVELFATDIIPSQIALQRDPILFDPSSTTTLGLP